MHEAAHPEGKQAYAKIAGRGWTFYVDQLEVRIGRPSDERQTDSQPSVIVEASQSDNSQVHIDLGPSKLISRHHAEIRYDETSGQWRVAVNGRNGAKLDESPLLRGDMAILHSGSVLDVAGTQMMFVTPNVNPTISPIILSQARQQRDENDDDDDLDLDRLQPAPTLQRTPTTRSAARPIPQHRPSSSQAPILSQLNQKRHGLTSSVSGSILALDDGTEVPSQAEYANPKASPAYARGLMLETTEDIDYSQDSAKDLKPPYSYAQLIGMAILSSPEEKLTLSKIYDWIKERYAFYRLSGGGWQVSMPRYAVYLLIY